ncbi:transporter [Variovorax sp. RT4R15]|uniref:transporter n=1 Tax=Variovorax sp. RT4R15 TaxID=3443737 RepID=UPI003F453B30
MWLPTGTYDRNQPPSLGENRYKFALQAGYITELAPGFNWDLTGDVTLFGKNVDVNDGVGGGPR